MQHEHDEYRGLQSGSVGDSRDSVAEDVSLEGLLEQNFLSVQTADAKAVAEEALAPKPKLIWTAGRAWSVSKKGYAGLIRDLASDVRAVRRRAEAIATNLAKREAKLSELDLMVQLLADVAGRVGNLQKRLNAKKKELELVKKYLEATESVMKEQSPDKGSPESELKVVLTAIFGGERVIHDFIECVCSGGTTLMCAPSPSYHVQLNAELLIGRHAENTLVTSVRASARMAFVSSRGRRAGWRAWKSDISAGER